MISNAQDNNDGISIVDVIFLLLNRKMIIFSIMIAAVCVGLYSALTIKRVYQAEVILTPPSFEQVKPLNLLDESLTTDSLFKFFLESVESRKIQKEFFEKNNILDEYLKNLDGTPSIKDINSAFESFSKSIQVDINKKTNFVKVSLESTDKNKVDIWLDDFIKKVGQETVEQSVRNLELNLDLEIQSLNNQISTKRSIYLQKHLDKITLLQESYQVAKTLGIEEQIDAGKLYSSTSNLESYMKGTKILDAEINSLKARDLSEFNTASIRDLEEEVINLKFLKIDKKTVKSVYIDTKAVGTTKIVRPDRRFIVMFSFIFGGFLAILVVFIIEFNNYIRRTRGLKTIQS